MKLYSHYQRSLPSSAVASGWSNYSINDALLYSYRSTLYTAGSFPSNLHYHDYYELIVIEQGNIGYICESRIYYPQKGDIILIPPGKFHMSFINDEATQYNRHVFYFHPNAFDAYGGSLLCQFATEEDNGRLIAFSKSPKKKIEETLCGLSSAFSSPDDELMLPLGISYILQFFYLLNQADKIPRTEFQALPHNILQLKEYIDSHYASVKSVTDVAKQFFYSREHAARLFKKHFDITISDYILRRKILESQKMILQGTPITNAAFAVGFNSPSAFIRGFRKIVGVSPSEYKKMI